MHGVALTLALTLTLAITGSAPGRLLTLIVSLNQVGLPFLLHAEFDLVASRGEVRSDSEWNRWLRGVAARAFSAAVREHTQLRDALPTFLPVHNPTPTLP